jgi:chemotaxis protein methyltransferase CheR
VTGPYVTREQVLQDLGYEALKHFVIESTGLSYYRDKDSDLAAAVVRAVSGQRWTSARDYTGRLAVPESTDLDRLAEELTIGETFFFRHREMFDALRDHVLPEIHARNGEHRQIRIWSAGCSVGAEPYSLSIMLRSELAHLFGDWNVVIIGTDINRRFLAMAREAKFGEWALRGMPEEERRRCFEKRGNHWFLQKRFTGGVAFQHHNLVRDRFPSLTNNLFAFDLVICRNVMIYFSQETIRTLAEQFHQALVPGGWLAVGHSEPHIDNFNAFQTVNTPGAILYHRPTVSSPATRNLPALQSVQWTQPDLPPLPAKRMQPRTMPDPAVSVPVQSASRCVDAASIRQLADSGEFETARECCEALLATQQFDAGLHLVYALLLEQMGELDKAQEGLRRALYLDRTLALAHYHAGLLNRRAGREQEARRAWRNAHEAVNGLGDEMELRYGDGLTVSDLRALIDQQVGELR